MRTTYLPLSNISQHDQFLKNTKKFLIPFLNQGSLHRRSPIPISVVEEGASPKEFLLMGNHVPLPMKAFHVGSREPVKQRSIGQVGAYGARDALPHLMSRQSGGPLG